MSDPLKKLLETNPLDASSETILFSNLAQAYEQMEKYQLSPEYVRLVGKLEGKISNSNPKTHKSSND